MKTFKNHCKEDFRTYPNTSVHIANLVEVIISKPDTKFRKVIPAEKRVGIALWRLATGNSCQSTGKTFCVAKSTAVSITHDFCE